MAKDNKIKDDILFHLRAIEELRNNLFLDGKVSEEDDRIWEQVAIEKEKIMELITKLSKETGIDYFYDFCFNNFDSLMKKIFTKKELASIKVVKDE